MELGLDLSVLGQIPLIGSFELGNESSGSVGCGQFIIS